MKIRSVCECVPVELRGLPGRIYERASAAAVGIER
jgi:hypothetical protein